MKLLVMMNVSAAAKKFNDKIYSWNFNWVSFIEWLGFCVEDLIWKVFRLQTSALYTNHQVSRGVGSFYDVDEKMDGQYKYSSSPVRLCLMGKTNFFKRPFGSIEEVLSIERPKIEGWLVICNWLTISKEGHSESFKNPTSLASLVELVLASWIIGG